MDMNLDYREGASTAIASHEGAHTTNDQPAAKSSIASKRAEDAGQKLAADMKVFQQVANELKQKRNHSASVDERCSQVLREAMDLFGLAPTWTAFYRATVGVEGSVCDLFPDSVDAAVYESSDAHEKVMEMLTVLRSRDLPDCDPTEPQRMITVRIPKSLHDSICKEANELQVSVNKLCITRMLQRVDRSLIPSSGQKRRGRRPGAEYSRTASSESPAVTDAGNGVIPVTE